ncbi:MAG: PAS domain S-box protein [Candidatus Kariarchaeaceae archaeon]
MIEQSIDGIILSNEEGTIIEWNKGQERISGFTSEEALGKSIWDIQYKLVQEKDRTSEYYERIKKSMLDFLKSGEAPWINRIQERTFKHLDGTIHVIQEVVFPIKTSKGFMAGSISRDITLQKQAEKALQESEERYRTLAEQLPNMVFIFNFQKIVFVNQRCEEIMGYSKEEMYSQNFDFFSLITPESTEIIQDYFRRHLENEDVEPVEYTLINKDRKIIPAIYSSKIITYEGEKAILGIVTDITKQKQMETLLREQKEENALYLDIISHDLNNYYFASMNFLELALRESNLQSSTILMLKKTLKNVIRGKKLLNSVSVLMRHKLSVDYELDPIDLIEELKNVKKSVFDVFPERNINIKISKQFSTCIILADSLFDQLLYNLLINAIKYDEHEIVNIRIELELDETNKFCLVSIVDEGQGIPPEYRESVFNRFSEFRKKGRGSGLGLHIVKTLVERYQGEIWIESRIPNDYTQGTVFKFKIQTP